MKYCCIQLNYDQCIVLDEYQQVPFVSHLEVHTLHVRENDAELQFCITIHTGLNILQNRDWIAPDFTTSLLKLSLQLGHQCKL